MMKKIRNPQDLIALRDKVKDNVDLRVGEKDITITVHMGTCGIAAGARDVLSSLVSEMAGASIRNVTLKQSGCAGLCEHEPMMTICDASGRQFRYGKMDKKRVREVVRQHLLAGNPVLEFVINA